MYEYVYKFDGLFYRELTDMLGRPIYKEAITESEYLSYISKYACKGSGCDDCK